MIYRLPIYADIFIIHSRSNEVVMCFDTDKLQCPEVNFVTMFFVMAQTSPYPLRYIYHYKEFYWTFLLSLLVFDTTFQPVKLLLISSENDCLLIKSPDLKTNLKTILGKKLKTFLLKLLPNIKKYSFINVSSKLNTQYRTISIAY